MLFIAGNDGSLLRVSRALAEAFGDTKGASIADLALPGDRTRVETEWAKLARDEGRGAVVFAFACHLRLSGGEYGEFSCRARRSSSGERVYGSLARKQASAEAPYHAAALLDAVVNTLDIAVLEIDPAGTHVYHDGKAVEMSGLSRGALLGTNVFELYKENPPTVALMRGVLGGSSVQASSEVGGHSWENWIRPVRGEDQAIVGAAVIALNVTERKRAERELLDKIELVERQKKAIEALSVPIIQVWDGVLTVPVVGMIDSTRAADLMEKLLREVARMRVRFAILDLTGVEAMDTATASHILRLIAALRLLGAEGILTGIRPSIAQTMAGLGVDMAGVRTLADLRDGLRFCMKRMGEGSG